MEQWQRAKMIRVLDEKIRLRSFDNQSVLLFGHCNATEEMTNYLLESGVRPAAILDNSQSKQGLTYRDTPIVPPEYIKAYSGDNSIVLIATRFYAEMSSQLRRLGYDGKIVQVVEYNSFVEYSLSDETFERKIARAERGMRTYEKIRTEYPQHHLVVCPNNALGDVYWAMSFLPAYCKKRGLGDTVIVVIGNGCCQVAELFGIGDIITLECAEMDEFVQTLIFTHESNCIIAHHDRPYTDKIINWMDNHLLSFIDYYRCAVYGLTQNTAPVAPCDFALFENLEGIPQGKSVILAPYAKSVVELPADFWNAIVIRYSAQGYMVYTNVMGQERPILGTRPLEVPISQIIAAAEFAGTFISIRNGLCDVMYTAKCRKIVAFPDCYYSSTPHKVEDFFALPGWETISANDVK